MKTETKRKTEIFVIAIAIPIAVGLLSALLTKDNMDIYGTIAKPALAPPGILFPIAWSVLYVLMGAGSGLIYIGNAPYSEKKKSLTIYAVQLVFNFFWSIFFFNGRAFLLSFVWILALGALIIAMIVSFFKISKLASLLQIPYLLWVTFAAYLNLMIFLLN